MWLRAEPRLGSEARRFRPLEATRRGIAAAGMRRKLPYEAPEVVASEPYDWSADVWSLGVLLYTMLAASWPEFKDGRRELNEDADWSSQCWRLVSDAAKDLIRRMMSMNPCERPTIDEVLCDAWLSDESCVNVLCPVACEALLERIAQNERDDGKDVAQQCLLKAVAVRSSPSLSTWLSAGLMSAPSLSSSLSSSSASSGKRVPFSESISSDSNSSHSSDGSISESSGVIDSRRGGAYGVAQCCAEAAKWEEVVQKSSSSSSYDEVEVELNPLAQQEAVRRRECCAQGESGCRDCSSDHDDGSGIGSSSSSSGGGSGSGFEWWQKSRLAAVAAWAVKNVWGPPAAAC
ncbi:hypothetical protein CLOM_g4036 [Closterium sp. NIES-68]|nr:hypothetical protein CLOM_g4036 [Closterium sp. NIES-68]